MQRVEQVNPHAAESRSEAKKNTRHDARACSEREYVPVQLSCQSLSQCTGRRDHLQDCTQARCTDEQPRNRSNKTEEYSLDQELPKHLQTVRTKSTMQRKFSLPSCCLHGEQASHVPTRNRQNYHYHPEQHFHRIAKKAFQKRKSASPVTKRKLGLHPPFIEITTSMNCRECGLPPIPPESIQFGFCLLLCHVGFASPNQGDPSPFSVL